MYQELTMNLNLFIGFNLKIPSGYFLITPPKHIPNWRSRKKSPQQLLLVNDSSDTNY